MHGPMQNKEVRLMKRSYVMRYKAPAHIWNDALPLGNGRLGAMVYGRTDIEKIPLNDDSLWYGKFCDRSNPALKEKLPEIRKLVLDGRIPEAEEMIMKYMVGTPAYQRRYTPLGELDIALNQKLPFTMGGRKETPPPEDYDLALDLETGVLTLNHVQNGVSFQREMFISEPAQVLCLRFTTKTPGAINLNVKLNRTTMADEEVEDDRRPGLKAQGGGWLAPSANIMRALDENTFYMEGFDAETKFAAAFRMGCDGELVNPVSELYAQNSSCVTLYLASSTSNRADDPKGEVLSRLDAAWKKGYDALKAEHIADFSALMNRCEMDLGEIPEIPVEDMIQQVKDGKEDQALAALYFTYGRYLIVSASRRGSACMNLQGIWNKEFLPMWDCKYTANINVQMNYWLTETGNLSDLHEPFMELLEKCHEKGKETAKVMYGMRGMVLHHNTDFYGDCAPQDTYMASTSWVMGGPWMAMHAWEHYLFTGDEAILRRMQPIFKDIALFFEDFLMEADGQLVTCPSLSPENRYILPDGYDTPICYAPAMDNQILREFFTACIRMDQILGVDADYIPVLQKMIDQLPRDQIGSKGQLLEWRREYPELTPGMGHVSHLYAAFPGSSINWRETPELMKAAETSLRIRRENQDRQDGWPLAWYICLYARMGRPEKTDECIRAMLSDSATRSLLNGSRIFQIDGNLGAAAGIAECLVQSHVGLHFLPALPESWKKGSLRGFTARGGLVIDLDWEDSRLTRAVLRATLDGQVEIIGEEKKVLCEGKTVPTGKTDAGFCFEGIAGKAYTLC